MMFRFLLLPLLFFATSTAAETAWRVEPDFSKKKARKDISGAACGPDYCFAVNDETHYIQKFKVRNGWLETGEHLDLLDDKAEIDAEGITYSDGVYFIAGSHGLSRKKAKLKPEPFTVFRVERDSVEASIRLGDAIEAAPILRDYSQRPLNKNGANIEGIAAKGDVLFFGFRGPSVAGNALVLETSAKVLFSKAELPVAMHSVPLGDRIGIRDMAPVEDGILLLTGPVNTLPRRFTVTHWKPGKESVESLLTLPRSPEGKPEGLLVLKEDSEAYHVLVFHDGAKSGAPKPFLIEKP